MSERNDGWLTRAIDRFLPFAGIVITIAAALDTIAWWFVFVTLAVLCLAAIPRWAVFVVDRTRSRVPGPKARQLALGSALVVPLAIGLGLWAWQHGSELRRDQEANDLVAHGKRRAEDGAHADAILDFRAAIDRNPGEGTIIDAYRELGRAYATRGEHPLAVESFTMTLRHYPEDRDARFERAQSLSIMADHTPPGTPDYCYQAAADLHAIVYGTPLFDAPAPDPRYAPAYHNLAIVEGGLGRFAAAHESITKALAENTENADFYRVLGQIQMARNERAAADDALQEAIDLAGDDEENAEIREYAEQLMQTLRDSDDDTAINRFDPCS